MSEKTTSEVAAMFGVRPDLLRKWKKRGFLPNAPAGVSGQGRSVECWWSDVAIDEVRSRIAAGANPGTRYHRPPPQEIVMAKLTKAQQAMLEELGEKVGRMHCDPSYKPIARLHELGLVDRKDHSMSAPSYALTPAGRQALQGAQHDD